MDLESVNGVLTQNMQSLDVDDDITVVSVNKKKKKSKNKNKITNSLRDPY
jgi:hypothetical protein